jgi:phosphate/sulfate permease
MLKYIAIWFPMIFIAILNGTIRQYWYSQHMSELRAHQLSTVTAILLFAVYIGVVTRIWMPVSSAQAVFVGVIWLGMTVAFEFLFGHYVAKHSWERLLRDYNLLAGRVWIALLIWITVAPYLFYRIRQR